MQNLVEKKVTGYSFVGPIKMVLKKLFQWEQLNNKGQLYRLPCTLYDDTYIISYNRQKIYKEKIYHISIGECITFRTGKGTLFDVEDLGARIFLHQEDAIQAFELLKKYNTFEEYRKNEAVFILKTRKKYLKNTMFNYRTGELFGTYENLFEHKYNNK